MSIPIRYDTIQNDYFKSQYVTLFIKDGRAIGYRKLDAPVFDHQEWDPIPDGKGGIALLNKATHTYLAPCGNYICGSDEKYYWRYDPKIGYYLETADGQRAWFLPSGTDGTWIELKSIKEIRGTLDQEKAEWDWKKA